MISAVIGGDMRSRFMGQIEQCQTAETKYRPLKELALDRTSRIAFQTLAHKARTLILLYVNTCRLRTCGP
jgi:hypothetical protein